MQRKSSSSVKVFYPRLNKEEIILLLIKGIEVLKTQLPLKYVVLFGSYAKGNYTVGSDIDLLVVYRGERRDDAYIVIKKTLNIPRLEPHVYTEEEYEEMKDILDKMTKDGILLFSH